MQLGEHLAPPRRRCRRPEPRTPMSSSVSRASSRTSASSSTTSTVPLALRLAGGGVGVLPRRRASAGSITRTHVPTPGVEADVDGTAMAACDAEHRGQAEASSHEFGREEWVEDARQHIRGNTWPVVPHLDENVLALDTTRAELGASELGRVTKRESDHHGDGSRRARPSKASAELVTRLNRTWRSSAGSASTGGKPGWLCSTRRVPCGARTQQGVCISLVIADT